MMKPHTYTEKCNLRSYYITLFKIGIHTVSCIFLYFLKYHTSPRGVFDISHLQYKLIMEYAFPYSLISNLIQNGPLAIIYERKNVWT